MAGWMLLWIVLAAVVALIGPAGRRQMCPVTDGNGARDPSRQSADTYPHDRCLTSVRGPAART